MNRRPFALLLFLLAAACRPVMASNTWTQPSPEELKMTSDPAAPGAPAEYLYLEETTDNQWHRQTLYARIKILTQKGVEEYSDVSVPYEVNSDMVNGFADKVKGIDARTIHSDGTVITFTGKPWTREIVRSGGIRVMEKGFSLPNVEVGSILEYRWTRKYEGDYLPQWYIQQPIFVRKAHYNFVAGNNRNSYATFLYKTSFLPSSAQIKNSEMKGWDLTLENIPPLAEEEDSPPMHSMGYRVLFYETFAPKPETYWELRGQAWSAAVDKFLDSRKLKDIVAQLVIPGESDDQKLRRIYGAVMKLENTDFTRQHTKAEDKADKLKIREVADIWAAQRGNGNEMALLFIGMARAAGLKAYAMMVTDRDQNIFMKSHMDWGQLDDIIAIVRVGGIETYFDPGERYCEYGKLHWTHTWTSGVRQTDSAETEIAQTPYPEAADTVVTRDADLSLDADGTVHGTVHITMTGSEALMWRQEAQTSDVEQAAREFQDQLKSTISPGLQLKMEGFTGVADFTAPLAATLEVAGTLATKTGHRLFVPGAFFEAQAKARFANASRENPVFLDWAYTVKDSVRLSLPNNMEIEERPSKADISFAPYASFQADYRGGPHVSLYTRLEQLRTVAYKVQQYSDLRDFFQKINAQDQSQLVLQSAQAVTTAQSQ